MQPTRWHEMHAIPWRVSPPSSITRRTRRAGGWSTFAGIPWGCSPNLPAQYVEQELKDWQRLGVLGHHAAGRPWIEYHAQATAPLAGLAGALDSEVVAMNSLTVNLHLMMVSFFRPDQRRNRILIEKSAFPSDRYAIVSQLAFHGLDAAEHLIEIEPRPGERTLRTEDVADRIEQEAAGLALVLLPGVQYLTGQAMELAPLIAAARRAGAAVGVDVAHAIGNTPLKLHDWGADFAVWCSYKYLNAGPGAVGGCFVHERHERSAGLPRFTGWWGHEAASRFQMGPEFRPIAGAQGWQISNPSVLSMAPLLASLAAIQQAGFERHAPEVDCIDRLLAAPRRAAAAGPGRLHHAACAGGARLPIEFADRPIARRCQTLP